MRVRRTSRGAAAAVAVLAACLASASGSGAATGGLKVVTQFQPPAAGQIELIATSFRARFTGSAAPVHPLTGVTLPGAGPPHTYGLLSGERLTRVQGDVATYVWLTVALKPLGAKSTHDQPLVGESLTVTPIANGSGSLHPAAQELTIDTSNPTELAAFGSALRADGTSSLSAANFRVWAYDDRSVFHWTLAKEYGVWNDVMATVTALHSSTTLPIGKITVLTGYKFAGGPGSTTGSTSPTSGTSSTGGTSPTSGTTPSGTSTSIGPLKACVDVTPTGSTTIENVKILDIGATGLRGTVTFNGQGVNNMSEPFVISTTGLTATPYVVTQPGTSTITISVTLPGGKTQQLTLSYTLNSTATTSTGCTPHQ